MSAVIDAVKSVVSLGSTDLAGVPTEPLPEVFSDPKFIKLKIKIKDLTSEARSIRTEEQKASGKLRNELHDHRVGKVRSAARHTHLAYGFLRGRSLESMEPKSYTQPDWKRVRKMLKEYGPLDFVEPECMNQK